MESKVQVAGSLNTPAYEFPLRAGIACCVLAPISYGLRVARWRVFRQFRGIVFLIRRVGPTRFLVAGAVALLFALAVRQARIARRRDLEILPGRFAMIDRLGRREYDDSDVEALAFRSRSAPPGMVAVQRGRARLWVDDRHGAERLDLDWEYPDGSPDPMAGFLGRIADRVHARAVKAIDSGSTVEGDGWALSRLGLQVGDAFEVIPFASIAQAEYHDGQLQVWSTGEVEPGIRIAEGSRNDAILHAILIERIPRSAGAGAPGLGRLLFERRATRAEMALLWGLAVVASSIFLGLAVFATAPGRPILVGLLCSAFIFLSILPALIQRRSGFRFHERGVIRSSLLGDREIRFEDLAEARVRHRPNDARIRVAFRPIPGRGLKPVALILPPTDEAIETIRAYVPGGLVLV